MTIRSRAQLGAALLTATLFPATCKPTQADSLDQFGLHKARGEAKFASGTGNVIFLAAGTLLPLLHKGKDGEQQTARTIDTLLTSTLITEGLKVVTHERRPDGSSHSSFPSGHATAAFAVAAMESHYHPKQALLWYGGATIIGASRVQLERHYWHDVIAGAAVGYFTAQLELRQGKGLVLRPFISEGGGSNHNDSRSAGFALSKTF